MSLSKPKETSEKFTWDRIDWMASLDGESPLLTSSQLKYITDVRHCMIRKAKATPNAFYNNHEHMKKKLPFIKYNFEQVVEYLKGSSRSREYFVHTYPEWRYYRNRTVIQLRDIGKAVNINSQNSASSRGVGKAVSLIGGLMCLATGAGALRIAGSILLGLGTLSSAGASMAETELLGKQISEARTILQEDKIHSEKLWDWISDATYVQEALDKIQNINVDENIKKIVSSLYFSFKRSTWKEQEKKIEEAIIRLGISPGIATEIADVIGILLAIFMLKDSFRPLFTQVFEAFRSKKVLCSIYNTILAADLIKSAVNASKNSKLSIFHKSRLLFGVVLNVIDIIHESKNAKSTSKEAQEVFKAAEKLEEEAKVFKKLYEAMIEL